MNFIKRLKMIRVWRVLTRRCNPSQDPSQAVVIFILKLRSQYHVAQMCAALCDVIIYWCLNEFGVGFAICGTRGFFRV